MTELIIDRELLDAYVQLTPAPVLSDEELHYLGEAYQCDPVLRREAFFDVFATKPRAFLPARPVEHAVPTGESDYRRLLPRQRAVAGRIDKPFLLEWLRGSR